MHEYWNRIWSDQEIDKFAQYIDLNQEYTFLKYFKEYNVKTVCDAACGFGKYSTICSKNGFKVSGFDITKPSIELTKKILQHFNLTYQEYKICNLTEIIYPDHAFDGVIAHACLDHLSQIDIIKAIKELKRITKPGGLLYISFDGLSEDDLNYPHIVLDDGCFEYTEGYRQGMIFRYYKDEEIYALFQHDELLFFQTHDNGERSLIIRVK